MEFELAQTEWELDLPDCDSLEGTLEGRAPTPRGRLHGLPGTLEGRAPTPCGRLHGLPGHDALEGTLEGREPTPCGRMSALLGHDPLQCRRPSISSGRSQLSQWLYADAASLLSNDTTTALQERQLAMAGWDIEGFFSDLGLADVRGESSGSTTESPTGENDATACWQELFKGSTKRFRAEAQHLELGMVIQTIFGMQAKGTPESTQCLYPSTGSWSKTPSWNRTPSWSRTPSRCIPVRQRVAYLVTTPVFVGFFMLLTVYAIFGMDLAGAFGNSSHEYALLVLNTVVFVCFLCELALHALGKKGYVFSIPCVLDVIALASMAFDTLFMQNALFDEKGVQVSRMARSSRVARLARLARIARFTRMLPGVLSWSRRRKDYLARLVLTKRLWRVFLFLDIRGSGSLSALDLKWAYLVLLHVLPIVNRLDFVQKDAPNLCGDTDTALSWDQFRRIFYATCLGKHLLKRFIDEIDLSGGVWNITGRFSNTSALKISCIVLALLAAMAVFENEVSDESAQQCLVHLDLLARHEHERADPTDLTSLCRQIDLCRQHHDVLLLYLDGRIHWEDGRCAMRHVSQTSLFSDIDGLIADAKLRKTEYAKLCVSEGQAAPCRSVSSACLIDYSARMRDGNLMAFVSSVLTVVLLLLFISLMELKLGTFTRALLNPLRELHDDMVILSDPRLAHLDKDMPGYVEANGVQELAELHSSFKSLRSSIKLWSKYTPPSVAQRLFTAGVEAQIGVAPVTATILFCDLEGFEGACKDLEPQAVLLVLSRVLAAVAEVIDQWSGTLLEFIGDEVLAVFNCPNLVGHHEHAGVMAALDIHEAVEPLQWKDTQDGQEVAVRCRCGVHRAGRILAGNIGSRKRMKYGLLGDGINLTARLKGLNARYRTQTLLSEEVLVDHCKRRVSTRPVDVVAVKGKKEPTVVYEALRCASAEHSEAIQNHCRAFKLYQERKFEEARGMFAQVLQAHDGKDGPSRMLMSRCLSYISEPPPADWDGVERLTAKSF